MVMIPPVLAGGTGTALPGALVPRVVRLEHQLFPGQKVMGAGKLMIFFMFREADTPEARAALIIRENLMTRF